MKVRELLVILNKLPMDDEVVVYMDDRDREEMKGWEYAASAPVVDSKSGWDGIHLIRMDWNDLLMNG